ncbi:hypothetical protein GALL_486560 [mine drainage metagenome]|uniref:Uncharacterized protein n=1 Tax=mine drainage metagenome TaxID=410659 RepID=A0A1J5PWP9_9ZZZZ
MHVLQPLDGLWQTGPLVFAELAGAQVPLVDATHRSHHAQHQLRCAHFHAEHSNGQLFVHCHVLRDIQRECGLAHRRTPGDDDQIARLQASGHAVEVGETRRYTRGIGAASLGQFADPGQQFAQQTLHRLETGRRFRSLL